MGKSFLQKIIDYYKNYETISVGKESIEVELKDLYTNAIYQYIKLRFSSYEKGKKVLRTYGIDKKNSMHVSREKDNTFSLKIIYKGNEKIINNIDTLFEDDEGHYNKKGYYDEDTVKKFNTIIFKVFDEIVGVKK